jgi:hypothetical protein
MTSDALVALEKMKEEDPALQELIAILTNLFTIRLALSNCPDFSYVKKIEDANDVAILAAEAKLELYFRTQTT